MRFTWWKPGSWNTICDVCGFKFKAHDLHLRWDGLMVCRDDWEIRHPQELIRPIQDQAKLPWTRPEATDSFISVGHSGSFLIVAGATSATITDANISGSSKIIITGSVPVDPEGIVGKIVPGAGTASVALVVSPRNDWTVYYVIAG